MAKHDSESQFYRKVKPALMPEHCIHNHRMYHHRLGYTLCSVCHSPMGWHPDLVRPGVYGLAPCDYHAEILCDCNTDEYRTLKLAEMMGTDEGMRMLAIGQHYFDALEGEPWSVEDFPWLALIGTPATFNRVNLTHD